MLLAHVVSGQRILFAVVSLELCMGGKYGGYPLDFRGESWYDNYTIVESTNKNVSWGVVSAWKNRHTHRFNRRRCLRGLLYRLNSVFSRASCAVVIACQPSVSSRNSS